MKLPIIHIGYHKTATTWFQKFFYPFLENASYVKVPDTYDLFIQPRSLDFNSKAVRVAIEQKCKNRPILCHEELTGNIHSGGLHGCATKDFANRLKEVFDEAIIVVFVRNQPDMIASCYRQYVKKGGNYSVSKYLFPKVKHNRIPAFSLGHFEYMKLVRHYQELFGKDNVLVFSYEEFENDAVKFIDNYLKILSLELNKEKLKLLVKANSSYGNTILKLARFINVFTSKDVINKYYILNIPFFYEASGKFLKTLNNIRLIRGSDDTRKILGKRNYEIIHNYYLEHNREFLAQLHIDLNRTQPKELVNLS